MKQQLLILTMLFFLFSCESAEKKRIKKEITASKAIQKNYWTLNNCMRSIPTNTLDSSQFKSYNFTLLEDRAIETAAWHNGDSLHISNEGCEMFWISYTFYIRQYDNRKNNLQLVKYCFNKVSEANLAPINFEKAVDFLDKMQKGGGSIKLGNEYFINLDGVSEMFEIDRIDLKKKYATIEFSFAVGKM